MDNVPKNQAEALLKKPIRFAISAIAIALMFSLALNSIVRTVYDFQVHYTQIIAEQQLQLAAVAAGQPKVEKRDVITAREAKETSRIIVKYKENNLPPGLTVAAERANLEKAQGLRQVLTIAGINAVVYEISEDDTVGEVINRIQASKKDSIEYAEVDMLTQPTLVPNDPYYTNEWHLPNIEIPAAWASTTGEGVTIAVLDTGVDYTHPDLSVSSIAPWNFYSNNGDVTDVHGHGTWVAGTVSAIGGNGLGVVGNAPSTKILGVRIAQPDAWASWSTMAQGIVYAADKGVRVVNLSYENSCSSDTIVSAANYLRSKGGVLIVSAGNSGADNAQPANDSVTCVSATGSNNLRTSWSSYGASVDISAPGAGIYTTSRGGGYGAVNGTSFSAPLTAGVYALMFSVNPSLTPVQADGILYSTADDLGEPGWDMYYGHGKINARKAVEAAKAAVGARDTTAPTVPANLKATTVSTNAISLAWSPSTDDSSGVAGYSIYRNGAKLTTIAGTNYTDSGLTTLTSYSYTVQATDVAGNNSAESTKLDVKTNDIVFGINSYSVPTKTANSATVAVNLTKAGTVTVKYGTSATNLGQSVTSSSSVPSHTLNVVNLNSATTYYYQVVATDINGVAVTSPVANFKTNKAAGGGKPRR
jgi:thermitase